MEKLPPPTQRLPRDRLSSLPDPIQAEILSLLPTQTAVSTSVLSTRWRSLWTQITSLHLDYNHFPEHSSDFYTIVNHLLLTQLTSPVLRTFYLHAPFPQHQHLESWLRHLSARNVEIIDIDVKVPSSRSDTTPGPPFTIPLCIFQTQSLVCLNFQPFRLCYVLPVDPHAVVHLPNLKKLGLGLTVTECRFVSKLLSSCPLLEDLSLTRAEGRHEFRVFSYDADTGPVIGISCGFLKRLELNLSYMKVKVLIDTPKLESFSLVGNHVACCFVEKPIALSEAKIITFCRAVVEPLMLVLLDVRVLHIGDELKIFDDFKDDKGNLLIFRNLTELNLQLTSGLTIGRVNELTEFRLDVSAPCLLFHVKKINVLVHSVEQELNFKKLVHYFLRNAPALERLSFVVDPETAPSEAEVKVRLEEMVFCMDLYSCSRESSRFLIEFEGQYAKVPTNIAEFQDMGNQVLLLRESLAPVDADAVRAS